MSKTDTPSAYEHFEREDARHFGLDGFDKPVPRELRDHIASGGSMTDWFRRTPEEQAYAHARGLLFAAFLDCLNEKRPYSLIPREPVARFDWAAAKRACVEQKEIAA